MPIPSDVLRLNGKQVNTSSVSCTGEQFALILQVLRDAIADYQWFIADIDAFIPGANLDRYRTAIPTHLGNTTQLIAYVTAIPQFLSGVFLGVPSTALPVQWDHAFFTEDEGFRDLGPAELELRAFDTTYIEIYICHALHHQILLCFFDAQDNAE